MSSSGLKFLVDVGVGTAVEELLREHGYDVRTVRSIDPGMDDLDIVRLAHAEERMVLTMDKDFGELVYHAAASHAGVLLLRLDDATGQEKRRVVEGILIAHADRIKGCFCVYQRGRLRIRPRPQG
jgi:predicted nuclease of predicted toxin-antitoxin system